MHASKALGSDDAAAVARAELFSGLPPDALEAVCRRARTVALRKGQALFLQGDPADAVHLVLRGRLKILETSSSGHAVVLRLEGKGALLGLLSALGGERYPVTAQALEPTLAARWSGKDLGELMRQHPTIALSALPMVLSRLRQVQDQLRELATERVEQRVARAVLRLVAQAGERTPEGVRVDAALTRQELAEMAGTTLFTVSRLLSGWAREGILQTRGRRLLVRQPHALVRLAEDFPGDDA